MARRERGGDVHRRPGVRRIVDHQRRDEGAADRAALRALLACLRGAPAWGGLVRGRPGWWRYGRTLGPLAVRGRAPDAVARALVLRARRAVGGALVAALVVDDAPDAWAAVHVAAALAARHVPVRCVGLRGGRVVPPPFR